MGAVRPTPPPAATSCRGRRRPSPASTAREAVASGPCCSPPSSRGAPSSPVPYNHYSTLATIEDLFGLPKLGQANTVSATFGKDVFTVSGLRPGRPTFGTGQAGLSQTGPPRDSRPAASATTTSRTRRHQQAQGLTDVEHAETRRPGHPTNMATADRPRRPIREFVPRPDGCRRRGPVMVRVSTVVVRSGTASFRAVPFCMPVAEAEQERSARSGWRPSPGRSTVHPTTTAATISADLDEAVDTASIRPRRRPEMGDEPPLTMAPRAKAPRARGRRRRRSPWRRPGRRPGRPRCRSCWPRRRGRAPGS